MIRLGDWRVVLADIESVDALISDPPFSARTDAGYRFGGFGGGAYIEPLATIAVAWSDLDGFTSGGNTISFDDEANVRGRVGLRVGTSNQVWSGVTMEPFVIGSLWSIRGVCLRAPYYRILF